LKPFPCVKGFWHFRLLKNWIISQSNYPIFSLKWKINFSIKTEVKLPWWFMENSLHYSQAKAIFWFEKLEKKSYSISFWATQPTYAGNFRAKFSKKKKTPKIFLGKKLLPHFGFTITKLLGNTFGIGLKGFWNLFSSRLRFYIFQLEMTIPGLNEVIFRLRFKKTC